MSAFATAPASESLLRDVQLARDGAGPLLQRDYWGVIDECPLTPAELIDELRDRFCEFPPPALVQFSRSEVCERPLRVGDELDIVIRLVGSCRVRLVCEDARSFTLATLTGHPEAGRITFGAYRHESGKVVFHIRSRCRASSPAFALGYAAAGEAMQTNTWTDFVAAVASTFGKGVLGGIRAETAQVEADPADEQVCAPTYVAAGAD